MRSFRRFFFDSSPEAAGLEVFFAAFAPSVVLAGALDAVEAGALPAVEAGLGAIVSPISYVGRRLCNRGKGAQDSGG